MAITFAFVTDFSLITPVRRKQYRERKHWNRTLVTIRDETDSITGWAKKNGVNYETVMTRMRKGIKPEIAVQQTVPRKKPEKAPRPWRVSGRILSQAKPVIRTEPWGYKNGVWVGIPRKRKRKTYNITIDGVTKTMRQWAKANGLKYETVIQRISYGWSRRDAVTTSAEEGMALRLNGRELTPTVIEFEGESHTLSEWANIKDVPRLLLYGRLRDGWTFHEAINGRHGPWYAK